MMTRRVGRERPARINPASGDNSGVRDVDGRGSIAKNYMFNLIFKLLFVYSNST